MEEFDLVNEKDEVIGTTTKAESHANGGIHRLAAVYVFDAAGKLYVQEHILSGKLDHSVGGHIRKGETYDEGAKREAEEELGLTDPLVFVSKFYSDEVSPTQPIRHMFGLYECRPSPAWKFVPNEEVKNITPMMLEEIAAKMRSAPDEFTYGFRNTMREYLRVKGLDI